MNDKKEKTLKSENIYKGKLLDVYNDKIICPNGTESTREYVKHPGGVCILPILGNKIILEKQYRYPFDEFILEIPAGKLEKNEDPIDAARRELEEETGYIPRTLHSLGVIYPSVGYTNEKIYLYYSDDLEKGKVHLDFDETLDIVLLDKEAVFASIEKGEIIDAKTVVALLKYRILEK